MAKSTVPSARFRTLYSGNLFVAQPTGEINTFQAAGSLPTEIGGLPFDADGDGVLEEDESFQLGAKLAGTSLELLINGQTIATIATLTDANPTANFLSLLKNGFGGGADANIAFDNVTIADATAAAGPAVVAIPGFDFASHVSIASVGTANGDEFDDFLVADSTGTHFYAGRARQDWFVGAPVPLPGSNNNVYDFSGTQHGFITSSGSNARGSWRLQAGGLAYTSPQGYIDAGEGFTSRVFATANTPTIDLTNVSAAQITFDSLLETENAAGVDVARVYVQPVGGGFSTFEIPGANNQPGGLLADNGVNQRLTFAIPNQALGSQVEIWFEFDTKDLANNAFYGWRLDNIRIDTVGIGPTASPIPHAGDAVVAGLGDMDGDLVDDFGVLAGGFLDIYQGTAGLTFPPTAPWRTIAVEGDRIIPLGDYDGDNFADILVTGSGGSSFVFGVAAADQPIVVNIAAGNLTPIGNFDNDLGSWTDFAAATLESTPTVSDALPNNEHQTVSLYLGGPRDADFANRFVRPALVVESAAAVFTTAGQQPAESRLIGSFGNVDGLGGDDLVFSTPINSQLKTLFGEPLGNHTPTGETSPTAADLLPTKKFAFGLATPLPVTSGDGDFSGASLGSGQPISLDDVFTLEGFAPDEAIARWSVIGDVNDDGFDDFVIAGAQASYVFFGPIDLDDNLELIRQQAALVLDAGVAGVPAFGGGRALGNPSPAFTNRSDLATLVYDPTVGEHRLHLFENSADLSRTLSPLDAQVTLLLPTLLEPSQLQNLVTYEQATPFPVVTSFAAFPTDFSGLSFFASGTRNEFFLSVSGDKITRQRTSLYVEESGEATFRLTSVDGARLRLDGELVLVNDFNDNTPAPSSQPTRQLSVTLNLERGWHDLEVEHFFDSLQAFGIGSVRLEYQPVGGGLTTLAGDNIVPLSKADLFASSAVGAESHWLNYNGDEFSDLMVTYNRRQLDGTVGLIIDGAYLSQQSGEVDYRDAKAAGATTLLRSVGCRARLCGHRSPRPRWRRADRRQRSECRRRRGWRHQWRWPR